MKSWDPGVARITGHLHKNAVGSSSEIHAQELDHVGCKRKGCTAFRAQSTILHIWPDAGCGPKGFNVALLNSLASAYSSLIISFLPLEVSLFTVPMYIGHLM